MLQEPDENVDAEVKVVAMSTGAEDHRCVDSCTTQALQFLEDEKSQEIIKNAEIFLSESKAQP